MYQQKNYENTRNNQKKIPKTIQQKPPETSGVYCAKGSKNESNMLEHNMTALDTIHYNNKIFHKEKKK